MSDQGMRILVADDDPTTRAILVGLLSKLGYKPVAVKDGTEALAHFQQPGAVSLAILDWVMPGMDGLDVIRSIRTIPIEPPPYLIFLTGRDGRSDIVQGLEAGANDYIKKPFDRDELVARVRVGQRSMELQARLLETQNKFEHLAMHDPLTGIFNRRAILEQLSRELSRAHRKGNIQDGKGPNIGYFDIDYFKQVNDNYGHQVGDEVLMHVASQISSQLREYDSFGRLGGDEFLLVVPELDEARRRNIFERLMHCISGVPFQTSAGEIKVTLSMGVAAGETGLTDDQLLARADAALYQAKHAGRNRLIFA